MKLTDAEILCQNLMQYHGVFGFRFSWMKRVRRFNRAGQCSYKRKTIELQPTFVELNSPFVVKQTILHEIAHALRPKHGHNKFWKMTARDIGHSGNRFYGRYVKKP